MDRTTEPGLQPPWNKATLPALLAKLARERPDAALWADCPQREAWNGMDPRQIKASGGWAATRFLAAQLVTLGVQRGDHVLILLANMVEVPMAILACHMAGAIPAIMPVDEKPETIRAAAEKMAVNTILTTARVGEIAVGDKARQVAAKVLTIRCVAGFGFDLPDGIVSLEGWAAEDVQPGEPLEPAPGEMALVTFMRAEGLLVPARRSHSQIIAEALAVQASLGGVDFGDIVSLLHPGSAAPFAAGFALSLVAGCPIGLVGPYAREAAQKRLRSADAPLLLAPAHFFTRNEAGALKELAHVSTIAFSRAGDAETAETLPATVLGRLIAVEERAVIAMPSDYDLDSTLSRGQPDHPEPGLLPAGKPWLVPGEEGRWEGFGAALVGENPASSSQAA